MSWEMSFIFPEIMLFDNGISFSFAAHRLFQTTWYIFAAAGRIRYLAIVCDHQRTERGGHCAMAPLDPKNKKL